MRLLSSPYVRRSSVLVAALTATFPWISVVSGPRAWAALSLAVAAGFALGLNQKRVIAHRTFRWNDWRIGVLGLLAIIELVAIERPWRVSQVVDGATNGFANLASAVLPVASSKGLLVGPIIVTFGSTWLAARLFANGNAVYWSAAPFIGNFIIATAFGARNNGSVAIFGAMFLLSFLVLFGTADSSSEVFRDPESDSSTIQVISRKVLPVAVFAVVAASLVAVQSHTSLLHGSPKSIERQIPDVTLSGENPSALLAALRYGHPTNPLRLFEMSEDSPRPFSVGADGSILVPIATLSKYDGMSWSLENLTPVNDGNAIPLVRVTNDWTGLNGTGSAVSRVTVLEGAVTSNLSRYLPALGGVIAGASGVEVNADALSGFGVSAEPLEPGQEVRVRSVSSRHTPPIVSPNSNALSPNLCKQLLKYLSLTPLGASCSYQPIKRTPAEQITDVVTNLRRNGGVTPIDTKALKNVDTLGQSFQDIQATVLGPQHMGSPEQYATFVALLARSVKLPARIVTGFRLSPQKFSGTLTSANSYTWAEIFVNGSWVVEDATPLRIGKGTTKSSSLPQEEKKPETDPGRDCPPSRLDCDHKILPYAPRGNGNALVGLAREVGLVSIGVVTILTIWAMGVSFLKFRRRRRRLKGSDVQQVSGALEELLDARKELGIRPRLTASTTSEIIAVCEAETQLPFVGDEATVRDAINAVFYSRSPFDMLPTTAVKRWSDRSIRAYRKGSSRRAKLRSLLYYSRKAG